MKNFFKEVVETEGSAAAKKLADHLQHRLRGLKRRCMTHIDQPEVRPALPPNQYINALKAVGEDVMGSFKLDYGDGAA